MREHEPRNWLQIWVPPFALLAITLAGLYESGVLADVPAGDQPGNWHEVTPDNRCAPGQGADPRAPGTIYRGARPGEEGLDYLQAQGFKSVLNLETADDMAPEVEMVKSLGLGLIELQHPQSGGMGVNQLPDFGGDDNDSIIAAVAEMRRPENFPLYVHCTYGDDRTGMVVALHRVFDECWAPRDAEHEWNHIEGWWHHFWNFPKHMYFHKVMKNADLRQYWLDQLQKTAPQTGHPVTDGAQAGPEAQPVAEQPSQAAQEPQAPMQEPGGVVGNLKQ